MKKNDSDNPYANPEEGLELWQPPFQPDKSRDEAAKDMGRFAQGVSDTSRGAYKELQESGKAYSQTNKIYHLLLSRKVDMSRSEIAEETGLKINAVCGRVHEMLKPEKGLLKAGPVRNCTITKTKVSTVKAVV